jgi:uncharacterized membrane protein YfcA
MLVSYSSANISKRISPAMLLVLFAVLMIGIGLMLLFRRAKEDGTAYVAKPLWMVFANGAVVGLLTGILGVGGGFLVVPALVMLMGLPVQMAVGTSLIIIAMNSIAGLLGHLTNGSMDWMVTLVFAVAGLVGTFSGMQLSRRMSPSKLQKAFAVFVIALAVFLLIDNFPKLV